MTRTCQLHLLVRDAGRGRPSFDAALALAIQQLSLILLLANYLVI